MRIDLQAALSLGLALLALAPAPAQQAQDPLTPRSDLVETDRVRLMLLDVEVVDKEGNPVRGLTEQDFEVWLNGKRWPVYSVDDLCDCPVEATVAAATSADGVESPTSAGQTSDPPTPSPDPEQAVPAEPGPRRLEPTRFVLYFDFGQLQANGRGGALDEAKRWVLETKQPEDLVMVAAFTSSGGLRTLAPFTSDQKTLTGVIDAARDDQSLIDPFAMGLPIRIRTCCECCLRECEVPCGACASCTACWTPCFYEGARKEHSHSRYALEALKRLLFTLEKVPGRKALLLFHQNGTMFPARYYPVDEDRVGDHITLVDQVGAEANLSRTAIYTAYSGWGINSAQVNLGVNLADFTGGGYNRGGSDLATMIDGAGRGCACVYRVALEPPENGKRDIHRVRVEAAGRPVPYRYRVQYLDQGERWLREALAVLEDPSAATDLPVVAAVVPVAGRASGWDVAVQVALTPNALALLPRGAQQSANWEVGALLADDRGKKTWEMLGVSSLVKEGQGGTTAVVVHERTFESLRPGRYEVRAFVRDRTANFYGGARAEIDLPRADRDGLVGPLVTRAQTRHLRTSLPLRKGGAVAAPAQRATIRTGPLPMARRAAHAGEPLQFLNWVCFGKGKEALYDVRRYVSLDGEPIFRFGDPELKRAGDCASFVDSLDTAPMAPGSYAYHVLWAPDDAGEPTTSEVSFDVGPRLEPASDL